ncbi:hypothetical protein [Nitrosospira sp. Is2]|uniref:hypothetical protein n=1 Tax=Nitrosospira sp. Is2 TaxID=3080532 RepID=UPI00295458D5|nr:hypothetical protein [Nitrosospira sp. Is2]WON74456.1 hypothetical protein R5L00_02900 [Nitrosospira sp. Is2]
MKDDLKNATIVGGAGEIGKHVETATDKVGEMTHFPVKGGTNQAEIPAVQGTCFASGTLAGLFSGGNVEIEKDLAVKGKVVAEAFSVNQDLHVNKNILVTGDIQLVNADVAEDFDVSGAEKVLAGTVMVFGSEGALCESQQAYDKRVAGVISGAGDYKPGLVLDKQQSGGNRQSVALMGKVFCKVDADFGGIEVGDLLTTSPTPGHAMKAGDPMQAFGTVIGKALRPLKEGRAQIPILVALQ